MLGSGGGLFGKKPLAQADQRVAESIQVKLLGCSFHDGRDLLGSGCGLFGRKLLAQAAQCVAEIRQGIRLGCFFHGGHDLLSSGCGLFGRKLLAQAAQRAAERIQGTRLGCFFHGGHDLLGNGCGLFGRELPAQAAQRAAGIIQGIRLGSLFHGGRVICRDHRDDFRFEDTKLHTQIGAGDVDVSVLVRRASFLNQQRVHLVRCPPIESHDRVHEIRQSQSQAFGFVGAFQNLPQEGEFHGVVGICEIGKCVVFMLCWKGVFTESGQDSAGGDFDIREPFFFQRRDGDSLLPIRIAGQRKRDNECKSDQGRLPHLRFFGLLDALFEIRLALVQLAAVALRPGFGRLFVFPPLLDVLQFKPTEPITGALFLQACGIHESPIAGCRFRFGLLPASHAIPLTDQAFVTDVQYVAGAQFLVSRRRQETAIRTSEMLRDPDQFVRRDLGQIGNLLNRSLAANGLPVRRPFAQAAKQLLDQAFLSHGR